MGDEVQPGFGAGLTAGQPAGEGVQPPAPAADASTPEPAYVTKDDLRQFQESLERRLQSLTDRQENRLKTEVTKRLGEYERRFAAIGQPMPDDVRQQVIRDTVLSYDEEDAPQAAQPAAVNPLVEYVNRKAQAYQQAAGVQLEQTDPEYRSVKFQTQDPDEFLTTWEAAVKAKAERVRLAQGAGSAAHAPMLGQGAAGANPIQNITDPRELIKLGLQQRGKK
jgi:hypothetical protein